MSDIQEIVKAPSAQEKSSDATSARPQPSGAPRNIPARRFLVALLGLVAVGMLLIAGLNFFLDPLHFNPAGKREVAAAMAQGKNYAVYDANVDFRGLRRESIAQMRYTPDVIVFAGSRFELATGDLFPGKTFYNAFVHNDFFEDLLAISELLYEHGRLPKNLVLSVRYKTFLPIDPALRETDEFKMFWPEYRAMADRLGIEKASWYDTFPFAYWAQLLSVDNIRRMLAFRTAGKKQRAVDESVLDNMEVIHADGSMAFSKEHSASFSAVISSRGDKSASSTADSGRKDAEQRAAKARQRKEWPLDQKRIEGFGRLLAFLREHGSSVSIAITPHHPAYWQGIFGSPYEKSISSMEEQIRRMAAENGAVVVGSLDPARAGCEESSIRDFIHLDPSCLKTIFAQIPSKT